MHDMNNRRAFETTTSCRRRLFDNVDYCIRPIEGTSPSAVWLYTSARLRVERHSLCGLIEDRSSRLLRALAERPTDNTSREVRRPEGYGRHADNCSSGAPAEAAQGTVQRLRERQPLQVVRPVHQARGCTTTLHGGKLGQGATPSMILRRHLTNSPTPHGLARAGQLPVPLPSFFTVPITEVGQGGGHLEGQPPARETVTRSDARSADGSRASLAARRPVSVPDRPGAVTSRRPDAPV